MFDRINCLLKRAKRSFRRMRAVAIVEALRILRDRTSFSLVVLVPLLQVVLFGFAVNLDPRGVSIAIAGGSPSSQEFVAIHADGTGYFSIIIKDLKKGHAEYKLEAGEVDIAIELADASEFFDDENADDFPLAPRVIVDGSNVSAVAPALAALEKQILSGLLARLSDSVEDGSYTPPAIKTIWRYNPERRTVWTIMPALIGVIVMISMLMLGALALAREKEQGSWETFAVMPIGASEILLAKLSPYVVIAGIQTLLVVASAVLLFDVPIVGSGILLFFGAILLAVAHLTLGFTISTFVSNQLQALQAAIAIYLPSMLLSGFMFPFNGMPSWAQQFGNMFPLTHFVRFARDVMLRGADASTAGIHLLPITVFVLLFGSLAFLLVRRLQA